MVVSYFFIDCLSLNDLFADLIKIDTLILLTDNEEWVNHNWIDYWIPYLQNINREAKAILIRADSYISHQPYPPEVAMKANIFQMYGYSDQVFKLLTMI